MLILGVMCHILSSSWVYIGRKYEDEGTGWIVRMKALGTLEHGVTRYGSLYIVSLYFVLTTLSTVGYGDVVGTENLEYVYQMITMVTQITQTFLTDYRYRLFRLLHGENEHTFPNFNANRILGTTSLFIFNLG